MPRRKPVKDTTIYQCWISGSAFEGGINKRFKKEYAHRRGRGFGYQVRYDLLKDEGLKLFDMMAELAADLSDEHGANDYRVDSIYRDLDRFPQACQAC